MLLSKVGMSLFIAILFVVLTPGVLFSIPPKTSTLTKAVVHSILFAAIYHFTHKAVWNMLSQEGFQKKK